MKIGVIVLSIALLLTARAARAQNSPSRWHTVRGIVVDELGKPAAKATVSLRDLGGHTLRLTQTDRVGRFTFGLLKIDDHYEIYAERANFISEKLLIPATQPKREIILKLALRHTGN
jgi:hypothetical protein